MRCFAIINITIINVIERPMTQVTQDRHFFDLDDMQQVLELLQNNQDRNGRGTLLINELGVKVDYDLYAGRVGPVSFIHSDQDVEVFYSEQIEHTLEQQVTKQVKEGVALLAKLYLLQRLLEVGDEKITKIIKSRHYGAQ